MSKDMVPMHIGDVSQFARSLRKQFETADRAPGHVETLNLIARAGGFSNFQHLKAQHDARKTLESPQPHPAQVNYKLVRQLTRFFDGGNRLIRWPGKFSQRIICLWALWARITPRTTYTEREISEKLDTLHLFGDHALLRRELADHGMVERTPDGREYRRLEKQPPPEVVELLRHLREKTD